MEKLNITEYTKQMNDQMRIEQLLREKIVITDYSKLSIQDKQINLFYSQTKTLINMQIMIAKKSVDIAKFAKSKNVVINNAEFRTFANTSVSFLKHVKSFGTSKAYINSTTTYKMLALSMKQNAISHMIHLNEEALKKYEVLKVEFKKIEDSLNQIKGMTESVDVFLEASIKEAATKLMNKITSGFVVVVKSLLEGWEFIIKSAKPLATSINKTIHAATKGVKDTAGRVLYSIGNKLMPEFFENVSQFVGKNTIESALGSFLTWGAAGILKLFGFTFMSTVMIGITIINTGTSYIMKANEFLAMKDELSDMIKAGEQIANEIGNLDI